MEEKIMLDTRRYEYRQRKISNIFSNYFNWSGVLYKYNNTFYCRHGSTTTEVDLTSEEYFEMLKGKDYKMLKSIQQEGFSPENKIKI